MTSNLVSYGADFTVRSEIEHSEFANSGCIMVWKAIVTVETGIGLGLRATKLMKTLELDWANPTTSTTMQMLGSYTTAFLSCEYVPWD